MTIKVGSNTLSLNAQRRLADNTARLSSIYEKLSSGLRINKASDDAAGLAISESLSVDSRVYTQAMRNVSDGITALNIEEGALDALTNILIRQRELTEQSANGTYSSLQRKAMDGEANALVLEYNRIVESTSFNGRKLLETAGSQFRIQAGYGLEGSVSFELADALARTVGTGTFMEAVTYALQNAAYSVAFGDLNGDGILDLAAAGEDAGFNGLCSILLGNNDGTFNEATVYDAETSTSFGLCLRDLDGDGILDVVTAGYSDAGPGRSTIRLGNGNGTFKAAFSYAAESGGSRALSLGDLNRDGVLDLVTAGDDGTTGRSTIRLGNGNGTFKAAFSYLERGGGAELSLADLDGDGLLDLVTAGDGGPAGSTTIRLGNGDGTFRGSASYQTAGQRCHDLALGDVDGDGALDLITLGYEPTTGWATVQLGNGDGTIKDSASFETAAYTMGLALGDINGDGMADLVTTGYQGSLVWRGNGNGTFTTPVSYGEHGDTIYLAALRDLNGDEVSDLVTLGTLGGVQLSNTRQATKMAGLNLRTAEYARNAMGIIDEALQRVADERGAVGAIQSRLATAANTLSVAKENFIAAGSRIKDTDVAKESADLARMQILQNAASAVLSQANQQPSLAIQLLAG